MKVYIGPYRKWFGPYQLVAWLKYLGVSEETRDKIAEAIPAGPLEFIHRHTKRKIKVRIDQYDTWSMDHTLAYIILPMLKQLKATNHGYGTVPDSEVPDHLKSTNASPKENEWDMDDLGEARWDWVMDEMIFAFEHILDEEWDLGFHPLTEKNREEYIQIHARIDNGCRLFGTHYQALWD